MLRIHPRYNESVGIDSYNVSSTEPTTLTVWRKSLLFNCEGFTVYDSNGNLVFRVDNYCSNRATEIILMDATGKDILLLRRKRFSLGKQWQGFCQDRLMFSLRRSSMSCWCWGNNRKKTLGEVYLNMSKYPHFYVEGSFCKRSCTIYNSTGVIVAEVKRKHSASNVMLREDVFSVVVQGGYDLSSIMGFIIILDRLHSMPIFLKRLFSRLKAGAFTLNGI